MSFVVSTCLWDLWVLSSSDFHQSVESPSLRKWKSLPRWPGWNVVCCWTAPVSKIWNILNGSTIIYGEISHSKSDYRISRGYRYVTALFHSCQRNLRTNFVTRWVISRGLRSIPFVQLALPRPGFELSPLTVRLDWNQLFVCMDVFAVTVSVDVAAWWMIIRFHILLANFMRYLKLPNYSWGKSKTLLHITERARTTINVKTRCCRNDKARTERIR